MEFLMKNSLFQIMVIVLLSLGSRAENRSAIQVLGETNAAPISTGVVFIGGRYMPPPYVVARKGNELQINGETVDVLFKWPPPEFKSPPIVTNPPKVPESITENSTCYDVDVERYIAQWLCYLRYVQSTNRVEEMVTAFRNLPCVKKAYRMDDTAVAVIWNGDDESMPPVGHHVYPERMLRRALSKEFYTPENLIKVGNRSVEMMYERLKLGDYYFLPTPSDRHSRHTGLSAKAQFKVALPLIDAGASAEEISKAVETQTDRRT
jgi:hypothetical protein